MIEIVVNVNRKSMKQIQFVTFFLNVSMASGLEPEPLLVAALAPSK
jgi:hypothetical protein